MPSYQRILLKLYFIFGIVFFIPINSKDRYYSYEFPYDLVLNINLFLIITVLLILFSLKTVLKQKKYFGLLFFSVFCVSWNLILSNYGSSVDYQYFGFILLLYPLANKFNTEDIRFITYSIILILFFYFLSYVISLIFQIDFIPIKNIRHEYLTNEFGKLRFSFPFTFGQSNAAGSILFTLFILTDQLSRKIVKDKVILLICFVLVLISQSVTSLFLCLTYLAIKYSYLLFKKKYLIYIILTLVISSAYIFNFILYKLTSNLSSLLVKLNRFFTFFKSPTNFIFGNNAFNSEPFYVESSFLDFWLNFGALGALLLLLMFVYLMNKSPKSHYFVWLLILSITLLQNSSLLLPNLFLFFLLSNISIFKKQGV
jgi:hypothetical protein